MCPTFSSRSSSAVTDAELQVDGGAQPAGGQRLPAAGRVHDRHERPDVGPVQPVHARRTAGRPRPARRSAGAGAAPARTAIVASPASILPRYSLDDRDYRPSREIMPRPTVRRPLAAARDHRPPLARPRRPPRLAGRRAQRRPGERLGRLPARQRGVHAGHRAAARLPDQPRAAGDPAVGGRRHARPAAARPRSATASTQATAIAGRRPRRRGLPADPVRRTARRSRRSSRSSPDLGDALPDAHRRPARHRRRRRDDGLRHRPRRLVRRLRRRLLRHRRRCCCSPRSASCC